MKPHEYIIITGSPIDGFLYIGTFKDAELCIEYAERHLKHHEYWINLLDAPVDDGDVE